MQRKIMNPRMRLAPGSRWDANMLVGANGTDSMIDDDGELLLAKRDGIWSHQNSANVTDALAVIDAAGLDKVRAAARKLREMYRGGRVLSLSDLHPAIEAIFKAVDEETETDG
jgi:hypothetical protein